MKCLQSVWCLAVCSSYLWTLRYNWKVVSFRGTLPACGSLILHVHDSCFTPFWLWNCATSRKLSAAATWRNWQGQISLVCLSLINRIRWVSFMSNPFAKCFLWTPRHDNMRDKSGRFWNYSMFILLFVNIFQYFIVKKKISANSI